MKLNVLLTYLLISVLGVISIVLPILFLTGLREYESSLFPMIRAGVEGISLWSFGFLFLSGFSMKFFSKLSAWKIGLLTMALFPVLALVEITFVDSTSHNLLPFEFILYGLYTIPGIIGAFVALGIQKILEKF